jgi:hypothetical protein
MRVKPNEQDGQIQHLLSSSADSDEEESFERSFLDDDSVLDNDFDYEDEIHL